MRKKIIFISSSGGHFEQLMMLKPIIEKNDSLIITEKTNFTQKRSLNTKYLSPVNRKQKVFFFKMIFNTVLSCYYVFSFKPEIVISTGTLCTIPVCLIAKIFGSKVVFIESFAKVKTPTKTGKYLYNKVDLFIVQWEDLLEVYPKAKFIGGIY